MGRQRSPVRDNAKNLWLDDPGRPLKDIAAEVGVSEEQVRKWKSVDRWDKNKVTLPKNKGNVTKTRKAWKKLLDTVEENDELTEKEKAFCYHYMQTFNGTAAIIRAGYDTEYPNRMAYTMLQKDKIQREIQKLKEIRNVALLADSEDVIERFMKIAFADITDYVTFGRETIEVIGTFGPVVIKDEETGEKETLTKEVNMIKFKDSDLVDGTIISEVKQGKDGASVKLADRMKALLWLADYFELNPRDRHKAKYDKRKMEIDLLRIDAHLPDKEIDVDTDDGFLAALDGQD